MKFSPNLPAHPGVYWYLGCCAGHYNAPVGAPAIVELIIDDCGELRACLIAVEGDSQLTAENFPGEWAGPIEPPSCSAISA